MSAPRQRSREVMEFAGGFLVRAFNLCNDPQLGYSYDVATQQRARELIGELAHLTMTAPVCATAPAIAQADSDFQRFMAAALPR